MVVAIARGLCSLLVPALFAERRMPLRARALNGDEALQDAGQEARGAMKSSQPNNFYDQLSNGYRIDHQLGAVYDHSPSSADDLTAIRGIDTREAVILNRLGV